MSHTKQELRKFRAIFNKFDGNGDGTLSHDEFRSVLDAAGYCLSESDLQTCKLHLREWDKMKDDSHR
ncbi:hypothetical protein LSH36_405g02090 [Paralvinella palmiformis]|uniref:EF-hand domain-containing protein n=1 Tax=Paralvinella palmiformis TaxID=53620 RepID=A0AAD9JDK5_9ANNE|nr:hypothetical protein LSH36_405g02090 [Paralvinella palmiformis]